MDGIQTFKAETMQAALDLVRANLGSDSVILHTRQVSRRHWLPFKKPIVEVEITASKELLPSTRKKAQKLFADAGNSTNQQDQRSTKARKTSRQKDSYEKPKLKESIASQMASRIQNSDELDSLSISPQIQQMVSSLSENIPKQPPSPKEISNRQQTEKRPRRPVSRQNSFQGSTSRRKPNEIQPAKHRPKRHPEPDYQQKVENYQESNQLRRVNSPKITTQTQIPGFDLNSMNEFASKLEAIEKMILHMGRTQQVPVSSDVPKEVFQLYTELIDKGVDHETARAFVIHLKEQATAEQLESYQESHRLLTSLIESTIKVNGPIEAGSTKRKVVALVGATGVGKTTTLAKLAGSFRLRSGIKVGLVTVDTYRVAAVDQLRTYAEIIDLPMKVVKNPAEMRQALDDFTGLDLVLIDTAGRSPRDELQIQELKSILSEAKPDEVHLVMSLTSSIQTLIATIQKFAPANPTSLIMTKLDEAGGIGPLLSLMHQVSVPISYLTLGQDVPDDIELAQPARIARLITGKEQLFPVY